MGVYGYDDIETVNNHLLDDILDNPDNKESALLALKINNIDKVGSICIIPKDEVPFKWDYNLHGKITEDE